MGKRNTFNAMINRLIVVEGIDGCGKTTLVHQLKQALENRGIPAVCFEDLENKNEGFNSIKPFIDRQTPIDSSLFFYIASAIHKSTMIKKLLRDTWVICDRYVYSTLAYHRARGADVSLLPDLKKIPIILPDFHFLLTVSEPVRISRLKEDQNSTKDDFLPKTAGSFYDKVERYLKEYKPIIIDGSSMDVKQTTDCVLEIIGI